MSKPDISARKKRYTLAIIVAAIAISVALYYAAVSNPYKTSKAWSFDMTEENAVPEGFMPFGVGDGVTWLVKSDESALSEPKILARLSNATQPIYSMLVLAEPGHTQFKTNVKVKIVGGEKEQAAGLLLRFQDKNHYFALVADALNDRFSLCRNDFDKIICTQDVKVDVETNRWYTITAHVSGQGVAGYLDDKLLVQRYDQHYQTGTIGLWAKGDADVYFDDLQTEY